MRLIDNWRKFYKLLSSQINIIGVALFGLICVFPDAVLHVWLMLPSEFKALIPQQYIAIIGIVVAILSIFARLVKQPKLRDKEDDSDINEIH